MKKEKPEWTVMRTRNKTLARFNYARVKQVQSPDDHYMSQDEFLTHLLDVFDKRK